MPAQFQDIELKLSVGLDQTSDDEANASGLATLVNLEFTKEGALTRRHGIRRVAGSQNTNGDFSSLVQTNTTLGLLGQEVVKPWVGTNTNGDVRTYGGLVQHAAVGTFSDGSRFLSVDIAQGTDPNGNVLIGTVSLFRLDNGDFNTLVQVIDKVTGSVLFQDTLQVGTYAPRIVCLIHPTSGHDVFVITCVKGPAVGDIPTTASIQAWRILLDVNYALLGPVTFGSGFSDPSPGVSVDTVAQTNRLFAHMLYFAASGKVNITRVDAAGAVVTTTTMAGGDNGNDGAVALCLTTGGGVVMLRMESGDVKADYYTAVGSYTSRASKTTIWTGVFNTRLLCAIPGLASGEVYMVRDNRTTGTVQRSSLTLVGAVVTPYNDSLNLKVLVRPWKGVSYASPGTRIYLVARPYNADQTDYRTAVVLSEQTDLVPVGQIAFDQATAVATTDEGSLKGAFASTAVADGDGKWLIANMVDVASDEDATIPTLRRIQVSSLNTGPITTPRAPLVSAHLGSVAYLATSVPQMFDGTESRAAAFVDAPGLPVLGLVAGSLVGAYNYVVVYDITDNHGNIMTSPPSDAQAITAATNGISVSFNVDPLLSPRWRPDMSNADTHNLRVRLYRTAADGSVFFLVDTKTKYTGDAYTLTDTKPDSQLGEVLYTTGGALVAEPAPPLSYIVAHRNRLFGIRSDSPETIAFTQETTDPVIARWNAVLTLRLDNDGGPPTALASMDDKLIIFQENQICAVSGQGPDGLGVGSFSLPELVYRGAGVSALEAGSVSNCPMGVMFRHSTGIYVLGRDLSVTNVGRQVTDEIAGKTVRRARYIPSQHQMWFLTAESTDVLVWDTWVNRWTVWSGTWEKFLDCLEHAGAPYFISANRLYKLSTSTYLDDTSDGTPHFACEIVTPWFRQNRVQQMRLARVTLGGNMIDAEGLTFTVHSFTQTQLRSRKQSALADNQFIWAGPKVDNIPAGGFGLTGRLVSQRCQAFRVAVTITPSITEAGQNDSEGVRLTTIGYEYGLLPTHGKSQADTNPNAS